MIAPFLGTRIAGLNVIALTLSLFLAHTVQGAEGDLARAIREDKQLCATPVGNRYQVKFLSAIGPTLFPALTACSGATKNYNFEMACIISADGHIRRTLYTANQPVAACLAAKLKGKSVPRPPRDSWPVVGHYSGRP